ncbi:MAG: phosphoglycerate dehydrogenase, partial [Actinomycetota bacterium]|nr:phosphoglycerate dehydrogenase [Actinomycetota bacterium]
IAAATDLDLVVRAGAGTDTIDLDAASENGVYVCNVPGQNAIAVAELTIGLLLSIDRNIADGVTDLRAGRWAKRRYSVAAGLYGRRMAVVGLGDIGLAVAERASAFGIEVVALRRPDRSAQTLSRVRAAGVRFVDTLEELLAEADIVSIHVPSAPDTESLVDAEFLSKLPDGAIVLNTSRGGVVDEDALLDAIDNRGFRAGLDVYRNEPSSGESEWSSPLAAHPRVTGSHHIGASTQQAQDAVADGVVAVIDGYSNGAVANCVNLASRPQGKSSVVIRHRDQVGVLAAVLMCLREGGINVQQMQNQIFSGAGPTAAVATIRMSDPPADEVLERVREIDAVLSVRHQVDA